MKKIYKYIIAQLFKLVYGKIKFVYHNSNDFNFTVIKKNKIIYKVYKVPNCRIYTDTIQDTAFIKDNRIIKDISFQLRNNINDNILKNSVFISGTPRILKKKKGSILSLLTGGGGNENYWHWMFDCLARIFIIEKIFKLNEFDFILVPDKKYRFQIETLKLLGIEKKSISSKKYKHIFSDNVAATTHPWQYSKIAHKDIENIPKWISLSLRKRFLKHRSNKRFYKKIYIDRSDSKFDQRKITNEVEIKKFLIKNKFKILRLSDFSFIDQIGIFNSAKIIIGNHGAGFANIVFCKKKTKIIEFVDKNTAKIFRKISKDLDLDYKSLTGKIVGNNKGNQNNDIQINVSKINNLIS